MSLSTASTLYLDNGTVVDSGSGIDIRLLNANTVAVDTGQSVRWTHTQQAQYRTFLPGFTSLNIEIDPRSVQNRGWGMRLTQDLTPPDDTNCNAVITNGTITVPVDANLNMTGGTNLGGNTVLGIIATLIDYNPVANTGVVIQTTTTSNTWNTTALGGENNTYKTTNVNISIPNNYELAQGRIFYLQIGGYSTSLPQPSLGTTSFDFTLRIGGATNTRLNFAAGQGIAQVCYMRGTAPGTSSASAPTAIVLPALGSANGSASVSGSLQATKLTTGSAAGSAAVTGAFAATKLTAGSAAGTSQVTGSTGLVKPTVGTSESGGTTVIKRPTIIFND